MEFSPRARNTVIFAFFKSVFLAILLKWGITCATDYICCILSSFYFFIEIGRDWLIGILSAMDGRPLSIGGSGSAIGPSRPLPDLDLRLAPPEPEPEPEAAPGTDLF